MAYTAAERLMNVMNNGLTVWLVLDAIALACPSVDHFKAKVKNILNKELQYLT